MRFGSTTRSGQTALSGRCRGSIGAAAMQIRLPDLGPNFTVTSHATGKAEHAKRGVVTVSPGVWLLTRPKVKAAYPANYAFEFVAPPERPGLKPAVWHDPAADWVTGRDLPLRLTVAAPGSPEVGLQHRLQSSQSWQDLPLRSDRAYCYSCTIPAKALRPGELVYRVRVASKDSVYWFPGGETGPASAFSEPLRLEQHGPCYTTTVFEATAPIRLIRGNERFNCDGEPGHSRSVVQGKAGPAWRVSVPGFGPPPSCVSWRIELGEKLRPWEDQLSSCKALRLRVRAGEPGTSAIEVVLLEADGAPWGCNVPLTNSWQDVTVPWEQFRYFSHWQHPPDRGQQGDRFQPGQLQAINFCFGAWLYPGHAAEKHAVEIESAWME